MAWPSVCFDPLLAAGQLAACRHGWRSQTQLGSGAGAAAVSCRGHNLINLPIREIFIIELPTKLLEKFSHYYGLLLVVGSSGMPTQRVMSESASMVLLQIL